MKHNFLTSLFATFFVLIFSLSSQAQSIESEIGIRLTNFESFGAVYKQNRKNDSYWRIRLAAASTQVRLNSSQSGLRSNIALAIGIEKRMEINENLTFLYGWEPFGGLEFQFTDNGQLNVDLGLGYVLGLQYELSPEFLISIETIPGANLSFSITEFESFEPNLNGNLGFNSNAVAISVVYRFAREKK